MLETDFVQCFTDLKLVGLMADPLVTATKHYERHDISAKDGEFKNVLCEIAQPLIQIGNAIDYCSDTSSSDKAVIM